MWTLLTSVYIYVRYASLPAVTTNFEVVILCRSNLFAGSCLRRLKHDFPTTKERTIFVHFISFERGSLSLYSFFFCFVSLAFYRSFLIVVDIYPISIGSRYRAAANFVFKTISKTKFVAKEERAHVNSCL